MEENDDFIRLLDESGAFGLVRQRNVSSGNPSVGRSGFPPEILLALILFGFSKPDCSLRELEERCRFDFRFRFISPNQGPSYAILSDIINGKIVPNASRLILMITISE